MPLLAERHGARRRDAPLLLVWLLLLPALVAQQQQNLAVTRTITGNVHDENGKPIAGAAIGLLPQEGFVDTATLLARPSTVTDAKGNYEIAGDAAIPWTLVIAAAGRQACAIPIDTRLPSLWKPPPYVWLPPGARLMGRVRDEKGRALAGVRVRVESSIEDRFGEVRQLAGAVSDAQGIFAVPCVPRTGMRVVAMADGCLTESRLAGHQSPCDLTLQRVGFVRGKVVDAAGAPVPGIEVYAVTVETREAEPPQRSAADGTFVITVPTKGRFRINGRERESSRQFTSGLLHGPADDVVLDPWPAGASTARTIDVTVVDAATKAPIPKFRLSRHSYAPSNLQCALLHHGTNWRAYEGTARLELPHQPGQPVSLVVDAPGHAFEVTGVPDELDGPLVVALGPEAVLVGRVIDAETQQPAVGVAVRALPSGGSGGSGGNALDAGPLTDAAGNYRIGGLQPGKYGVQVHGPDRPASKVDIATVAVGTETRLDLVLPERLWVTFEVVGAVPAGVLARLQLGEMRSGSPGVGSFEHSLLPPLPRTLPRAGTYKLGPVGAGQSSAQLWFPSRTRIGAGTTVELGMVEPGTGGGTINLAEMSTRIVRGRVLLPKDVPTERVGVLVRAVPDKKDRLRLRGMDKRNVAGLDTDGNFEIDLPTGSYYLQLVDVSTGILFHTEEEDLVVGDEPGAIAIQPVIRWLELEFEPEQAGGEIVLSSIDLDLPRPRKGACGAFEQSWRGTNKNENGSVPFRPGATRQRWLMPQAHVELRASYNRDALKLCANDLHCVVVATVTVDIDRPAQKVTLAIPAPPTDAEILRKD